MTRTSLKISVPAAHMRSLQHIARVRGCTVESLVCGMVEREVGAYIHRQITGRPKLQVVDGGGARPEGTISPGPRRAVR